MLRKRLTNGTPVHVSKKRHSKITDLCSAHADNEAASSNALCKSGCKEAKDNLILLRQMVTRNKL